MYQLIFCTCPDFTAADAIARHLVGERLAACCNIMPGLVSVYSWKGRVETAQEHLLIVKSSSEFYHAIETAIKTLHPYELPEIVAVAIEQAVPDYLKWIDSCLTR